MTRQLTAPEARRRIVTKLKPGREYTLGDMSTLCGISEAQASCAASALVGMGLMRRECIQTDRAVSVFTLMASQRGGK